MNGDNCINWFGHNLGSFSFFLRMGVLAPASLTLLF
jgi:hypothetical protein